MVLPEIMGEVTVAEVNQAKSKLSGKILIAITGGIGVGLTIICSSFVAPAFRKICLPYVPATENQIENVLACIPKTGKIKLLDIGSGDGRIVIAAAKHGAEAVGVELNPWLVFYSRLAAWRSGVYTRTKFYRKDLWKFDMKSYNYVSIFGVEQMMKDLEEKLIAESSANIIACRFPLPYSEPKTIIGTGVDTVWLYDFQDNRKKPA